jgi:glycosyltransferase involved in cell wall biosynthesis
MPLIDVLILGAQDAARRSLESVRAARCECAHEVALLGDCGFAALDEALRRHRDRDVVLIEGGVRVADGWLDRLAACARREPLVATVTPFSNDAAFCGYRADLPLAALDALFAAENAGASIDIPTAIGGCVFIAREAIAAADGFDARFAEAGALIDFCVRAARAGYRHLLSADLFVRREAPAASIPAAIDERHPGFAHALQLFLKREPTRPCRRRVDLARLRASPRARVLMVTHAWGGGVERHVRDLARLMDECEVLQLRPADAGTIEIEWLRDGEELHAWIEAAEWQAALDLLASVGIDRVHFHHVHDLPREALALASSLGAPYDVTLHDYFPICPRYHLAPGEGGKCTVDELRGCDRCLAHAPAQWGLALGEWRDLFHAFLRGAERVIAPSHDVVARMQRHFPDVAFLEWPHPEMPRTMPAIHKVALLGGISPAKGARLLEACVADAAARGLPLHFRVLGQVDRPTATWPAAPLSIAGTYSDDTLAELLAIERPDAFLFLAQVPETYSYTLTWAMRTGLPIVATRLGAFPERLRNYRAHTLVAPDAPAASINDAILARVRRGAALEAATPAE